MSSVLLLIALILYRTDCELSYNDRDLSSRHVPVLSYQNITASIVVRVEQISFNDLRQIAYLSDQLNWTSLNLKWLFEKVNAESLAYLQIVWQ